MCWTTLYAEMDKESTKESVKYAQKVDNVAEALSSTPVQALFEAVSSRFERVLGVGGR